MMIRSALVVSLACACAFLPACFDDNDDDQDTTQVHVRVHNDSGTDFDQVVVTFPAGDVNYGSVPSGGESEYRAADGAFAFAPVEVTYDSTTLTLQVIDYIGAEPLSPGNYTYSLDVVGDDLTLTLQEDS